MSNITQVSLCVFTMQHSNQIFNLALFQVSSVSMAEQTRKRKFSEIEQLDNVDQPLPNSCVHGAITSISPVKRGRGAPYFDGMLADDTSKIRFVGFESFQQKKLFNFQEKNVPVKIENCEIKSAKHGDGYEVILKSNSQIKQSPRKLDACALRQSSVEEVKTVCIEEMPTVDNFEKVNLSIKVIDVSTPDTVGDLSHQDVFVADHTGSIRVCLWNDSINSLQKDHSYKLTNFTVREFHSTKYLNMPKSGTDITPIADVKDVVDAPPKQEETTTINNVQIVGVPALNIYKACLQCKARVEPCTPPFGKCSKEDCNMIQRYDLCTDQATAKLLLMYKSSNNQQKYITCSAFGQLVMQLADLSSDEDVTSKALLNLPLLKSLTYVNEKLIITAFEE